MNLQMANDNLKKNLKDILKIKGEVTPRKRQAAQLKTKEFFVAFIESYKYANERTLVLKNEFKVDFIEFEEPFVRAIEALLALYFTSAQKSLIEWWLYEKWQLNGDILQLTNEDTQEEIPTDSIDDLWNLIQNIK